MMARRGTSSCAWRIPPPADMAAPRASGPLAGRTALVTGASKGIGAAIARHLSDAGVRVALVARRAAALDALARTLDHEPIALAMDLQDPEAGERARAALAARGLDSLDIIVNNAGAFFISPADETGVPAFRSMLDLNLTAPFQFARAFLPAMRARGAGHLLSIGSIADRTAFAGTAAYAASKYGLRALHEVLRAELRGSGVRTTLVSPGPVDTGLWDTVDPAHRVGHTPRASMLSPAAVADAVLYALSAHADVNVDELRLSHS